MAVKFFEHFVSIADAMDRVGAATTRCGTRRTGSSTTSCGCRTAASMRLKVRSMVGLLPLCAVDRVRRGRCRAAARLRGPHRLVHRPPPGARRQHRDAGPAGAAAAGCCRSSTSASCGGVLAIMLDESEFLSPYGIRSLSQAPPRASVRASTPRPGVSRRLRAGGVRHAAMFGGNSNWRGPIWMPVNLAVIRALMPAPLLRRRLQGRVPDRLRRRMTLAEIAHELRAA